MYAVIKNGQIIATGEPKKLFPNISFPSGNPSEEWLAANNTLKIVDQGWKDQRFYWVTDTGLHVIDGIPTRTYTNTPKDLDQLKAEWIDISKHTAKTLLAETDWYVIRKSERDVAIPEEVLTERAQIIADCEAKEAAIAACTTVEELIAAI